MNQLSLFDRIGGDATIRVLVDEFYTRIFKDEQIAHLFKNDIAVIKEKQRLFLTQFLGGPPLYLEVHGHPQLRARHLPHPIGEEEAIAWLRCMDAAVSKLEISIELKNELFDRFPRTAFFMVNKG